MNATRQQLAKISNFHQVRIRMKRDMYDQLLDAFYKLYPALTCFLELIFFLLICGGFQVAFSTLIALKKSKFEKMVRDYIGSKASLITLFPLFYVVNCVQS